MKCTGRWEDKNGREDRGEHNSAYVEPGGPSESKGKLLANVVVSVLLYGTHIWADTINTREYQSTKIFLVQQKAALKCVSAYLTVSKEAVCVLAGIPLIEIAADERTMVYSATYQVSPGRGKVL